MPSTAYRAEEAENGQVIEYVIPDEAQICGLI